MHTVHSILQRKGSNVISVAPETLIVEVLRLMSDKNIGAVVVAKEGKYQGLFTERVYARRVAISGKSSFETPVGEVMATDFPTVTRQDKINHCMTLMTERNIRYLPVMEGGELLGIISVIDVVMEELQIQKELVSHMQDYMMG